MLRPAAEDFDHLRTPMTFLSFTWEVRADSLIHPLLEGEEIEDEGSDGQDTTHGHQEVSYWEQ